MPRIQYVKPKTATELLDISYDTLRDWARTGKITEYRIEILKKHQVRYSLNELRKILKKVQI